MKTAMTADCKATKGPLAPDNAAYNSLKANLAAVCAGKGQAPFNVCCKFLVKTS